VGVEVGTGVSVGVALGVGVKFGVVVSITALQAESNNPKPASSRARVL